MIFLYNLDAAIARTWERIRRGILRRATRHDDLDKGVHEALSQLDGTSRSAVRLMTGFSDECIDELGGIKEDDQ